MILLGNFTFTYVDYDSIFVIREILKINIKSKHVQLKIGLINVNCQYVDPRELSFISAQDSSFINLKWIRFFLEIV